MYSYDSPGKDASSQLLTRGSRVPPDVKKILLQLLRTTVTEPGVCDKQPSAVHSCAALNRPIEPGHHAPLLTTLPLPTDLLSRVILRYRSQPTY